MAVPPHHGVMESHCAGFLDQSNYPQSTGTGPDGHWQQGMLCGGTGRSVDGEQETIGHEVDRAGWLGRAVTTALFDTFHGPACHVDAGWRFVRKHGGHSAM